MKTLNDVYQIKGEQIMLAVEHLIDCAAEDNKLAMKGAYLHLATVCRDDAEIQEMMDFADQHLEMITAENAAADKEMAALAKEEQEVLDGIQTLSHTTVQNLSDAIDTTVYGNTLTTLQKRIISIAKEHGYTVKIKDSQVHVEIEVDSTKSVPGRVLIQVNSLSELYRAIGY